MLVNPLISRTFFTLGCTAARRRSRRGVHGGADMHQNKAVKHAILKALAEIEGPAGATRITGRLPVEGINLQPRTIR